MSDSTTGFGERLRQARENRKLKQTELAAKTGLQPAAIGHFEKGRRKPSFANIRSLAMALNVTSDYLLGIALEMGKATTALQGEEKLSDSERGHIQMMINLMNQKKENE